MKKPNKATIINYSKISFFSPHHFASKNKELNINLFIDWNKLTELSNQSSEASLRNTINQSFTAPEQHNAPPLRPPGR